MINNIGYYHNMNYSVLSNNNYLQKSNDNNTVAFNGAGKELFTFASLAAGSTGGGYASSLIAKLPEVANVSTPVLATTCSVVGAGIAFVLSKLLLK